MKRQVAQPLKDAVQTAFTMLSFALILLLVLCTPFVEMSGEVSAAQSSYRIYGYGLFGLLQIALIALRGWERSWRIFLGALTPFLVWAALSVFWTQHVDLTSKRLILLTFIFLGTFGGVCALSHERSLSILRIVLVAALVLNLITVLIAPDLGTHYMQGGHLWRGLMAHKNIAGMLCAFTVIAFTFDDIKTPLPPRLLVSAGALVFLYFSWSKTALLALPVSLMAGGVIVLIGSRKGSLSTIPRKRVVTASFAMLAVAFFALVVLTVQRDLFLSFTNDTSTLTTRGAIWRPMIQFYLDHPLLGSGYGAYWDASDTLIDPQANKELWKNVDQGHNGYLDLLVQVGLPGLMLALYAVVVWPAGVIADMIGKCPQRAALVVAILIFSLIENFSESSLLADDALGNAFLLIGLAYAHRFALRSGRRTNTGNRVDMINAAQLRSGRQERHQSLVEN
ncbi:O-antigen ligase family protein [Novosphingobium fluoreni]|uniref:O-antigen ligase family protein n=1 Tax=Novosphingobium fluoreni TaxID=1391222 RepID=UPI003DA0A52D